MAIKDFDEISVFDIAKGAHITRRAFYNHYKDKYDLVSSIFSKEVMNRALELTDINTWDEGSILICNYLHNNREYYAKLIHIRGQNSLQEQFLNLTRKQTDILIKEVEGSRTLSKGDTEFLTKYLFYAYIGILEDWIKSDNPYSPEDFVLRWKTLLNKVLHNYIDKFAQ